MGLIPGSERSPEEGNSNPLQYCAWKIPWTEEPGGLQSVRSQRVRHDRATLFHTIVVLIKSGFPSLPSSPVVTSGSTLTHDVIGASRSQHQSSDTGVKLFSGGGDSHFSSVTGGISHRHHQTCQRDRSAMKNASLPPCPILPAIKLLICGHHLLGKRLQWASEA